MKKWSSKIYVVALGCIVVAGLSGFFFVLSQQKPLQIAAENSSAQGAQVSRSTITMKNITLHEYEKKHGYEFVMTAEEGTFNHISDKVECCDFACKILQHGASIGIINAHKSCIDQVHKQVLFVGPIKGIWKDLNIEGADIGYSFLSQIIKTEKTMKYTHPQFSFSANQSTMNMNTETIHMSKGVYTEFHTGT